VEPDRWILDRKSGQILSHHPARREKILSAGPKGVRLENLQGTLRHRAPLRDKEVKEVYDLAMKAESLFGSPRMRSGPISRKPFTRFRLGRSRLAPRHQKTSGPGISVFTGALTI